MVDITVLAWLFCPLCASETSAQGLLMFISVGASVSAIVMAEMVFCCLVEIKDRC